MMASVRVLLIDGDEEECAQVRRIVGEPHCDIELIETSTLAQARRALQEESVDCMLVGRHLPDGDGLELVTDGADMPAIVLTEDGSFSSAQDVLLMGAQDHVVKDEFDVHLVRAIYFAIGRKQAQSRLLHAGRMSALGHLAASVAHEINNPNAFVFTNLQLMERSIETLQRTLSTLRELANSSEAVIATKELRSALAPIQDDTLVEDLPEMVSDSIDGVRRVTKIVHQLQSFARDDDDEFQQVDLNEVVQWACAFVDTEIRYRARLVQDLGEIPRIPGIRAKISQLLTNLLLNAAQSIEGGDVANHAVTVRTFLEDSTVCLQVDDTGTGIPESVRERIFEPFFTTRAAGQGSGLGLTISNDIMHLHNGTLELNPHHERGTSLRACFPLQPIAAQVRTLSPKAMPIAQARLKILVIDDEKQILNALLRLLSDHDVVCASGGMEALALVKETQDWDGILCDVMMPDLDGPKFFIELKEKAPELTERVVFCTGGAFTQRVETFLDAVNNRVLQKPFSLPLIDKVIFQWRLKQAARRAKGPQR